MIIYPLIELQDGKCVNLRRGDLADRVVFETPPVEAAKKFAEAGAEWLYLVDLDGVAQGGRHNGDAITDIMKAVDIPCMVGGGIRSVNSAQWWVDAGAQSIVLGTAAVKDRTLVRELCAMYPGKVCVSIDGRGGKVVIEGWREETMFSPLELATTFEESGVSTIIFTDVDMSNGTPEAGFAETTQLATNLDVPVIANGVIRSLDDISTLKQLPRISGCIVGRALFQGNVSLEEAIAIGNMPFTRAEFI
ncbi:MAG: 1-(5-phosphoribosyl)-5-[(5-phosphoribosylamino)methylideneamino] imidazole-4-carboxamide isomerase [Alphaproteobacteria bacterium]